MRIDLPLDRPVVEVITTNHRGATPEEIAQRAANRIVNIAETASPEIAAQALAFKDAIERVITRFMHEAIASNKTTVYNALVDAGHPDLAKMIWRL